MNPVSIVKDLVRVPDYIKSQPTGWVLWRFVPQGGRIAKIPHRADGYFSKSNDPSTWSNFPAAMNAMNGTGGSDYKFEGLGYMFHQGDGLVGIDLDHCFDKNDVMAEWAAKIVEAFNTTYIEVSPSGNGLHIICLGSAPRCGSKKWKDENGQETGIEVYDWQSPRYFTVTGNNLNNCDVTDCQSQLDALYDEHWSDEEYAEPAEPKTEEYTNDASVESIEHALSFIPADDHGEWIKIGMALQSSGFGVDVWDRWSSKSSKYSPGECQTRWEKLEPRDVSIATVFYFAKKYNPDFKSLNSHKSNVYKLHLEAGQSELISEVKYLSGPQHNKKQQAQQERPALPLQSVTGSTNQPIVGRPVEHPRWFGYGISHEFRLTEAGLLKCTDEKPNGERVCGPIFVTHNLHNSDEGVNAGLLIEFQNRQGAFVQFPLPRKMLHEDIKYTAGSLGDCDFYIRPGKEKDLITYLADSNPVQLRVPVAQTGWVKSDDKLAFVFPDSSTDPNYQLQTGAFVRPAKLSAGTLSDWIENVWVPASTSHYGTFIVCAALSSALLKPSQLDSGGFHFYGSSSSGKTTLMQVGASVNGNGTHPAESGDSSISSWNTTVNGLEGLASATNDSNLLLDELAQCPAKDFGKAIYDLSNGQGKSVMDSRRQMRAQRTWRIGILSSGEVSSRSKIEDAVMQGGKKISAKAGQMLRLIDIAISKPIYNSRIENDKVKRNCGRYYGTLGRIFIREICQRYNVDQFRDIVQDMLDKSVQRMVNSRADFHDPNTGALKKISNVEERALKRFALSEVAGLLLVRFGLVPGLDAEVITDAVDRVVFEWSPQSKHLLDAERGIDQLQEFILLNRDTRIKKFASLSKDDKLHREIAGYYDESREVFFMLRAGFKEATGCDPAMIAEVMDEKGMLLVDEPDRHTHRITIDNRQVRTYGVKASLLGESIIEEWRRTAEITGVVVR